LVFLEHGFEEWRWSKSPHDCLDARVLSDEQIARPADFVAQHFGDARRDRWLSPIELAASSEAGASAAATRHAR
jgi:hypothetical protein